MERKIQKFEFTWFSEIQCDWCFFHFVNPIFLFAEWIGDAFHRDMDRANYYLPRVTADVGVWPLLTLRLDKKKKIE